MNIELLKLLICKADKLYKNVGQHLKNYSLSTIKLIEKYLEEIKEVPENRIDSIDQKILIDNNENIQPNSESPKKRLGFLSKGKSNFSPANPLAKEENSELQKALLNTEASTNLIMPFKIRFKNSYLIDFYKRRESPSLYHNNLLDELEENDNEIGCKQDIPNKSGGLFTN